ncbi:MAG: zinc-ribbon domain-containing protein, partial [Candidatus Dormiibacterota bacterium]
MIVCTKCGFHNADSDTFCGSCGSFLEWTGQKGALPAQTEAPPPEPEEDASAAAGRRGLMSRIQSIMYLGTPDKEAVTPPAGSSPAIAGRPAGF